MKLEKWIQMREDRELYLMLDKLEVEPNYRTLEMGCCGEKLSYMLQELGCEAWGVDLHRYEDYQLPLKHYIQGNFLDVELPSEYFDVAIDISAMHHFGLVGGPYAHGGNMDFDADIKTAQIVYDALKPGGYWYLVMDRIKHKYIEDVQNLHFVKQYTMKILIERIAKNFKVCEQVLHTVNLEVVTNPIQSEIGYLKLHKVP